MSQKYEITLEVNPSLQQYFQQDDQSDIVIKALAPHSTLPSTKAYKLQKGYLYAESEYFWEQFKNSPDQQEIVLQIEQSTILENILKCFYGFTCTIDNKNIFEALEICQYLKIEGLLEQIVQYILQNVNELDIVKVWISSQKEKNLALQEACVQRFKREEYAIFINPNAYNVLFHSNSIYLSKVNKSEIGLTPSAPTGNVVEMTPELFKKALLSQGNDFQFLKRKNVFTAIKLYCEKKYASDKAVQNNKICKMTSDLIKEEECNAEDYRDIYCQQMFHNYKKSRQSSGNLTPLIQDFRQSQFLQTSSFYNTQFHNMLNGGSVIGNNLLSPSSYLGKVPQSPTAAYLYSSQIGAESLIFVKSMYGTQHLEDKSEKLNTTFDALKESYQNFLKMSSSSQNGNCDQSVIQSCELQLDHLEKKMKNLLDDKQLKVSGLDEEIKKVDQYFIDQKKNKQNVYSMLNSNYLDDMNKMLTSSNNQNQNINLSGSSNSSNSFPQLGNQILQSQHFSFNPGNDDLQEVERQIQKKSTLKRLMSNNSSDNNLENNRHIVLSDAIPDGQEGIDFQVHENPFQKVDSDNEYENNDQQDHDNNPADSSSDDEERMEKDDKVFALKENAKGKADKIRGDGEGEDNNSSSDCGDVDIDEMMQDIDEFDHATPYSLNLYEKKTVLNTPHINLDNNSVLLINNIQQVQPENIEASGQYRLNQSNTYNNIYYYNESEQSGGYDYRKYNHQSAIKQKPTGIYFK